ncbi:MAG: RagB/SusD family nutrient uptake outer membrane protein [Tannerella sp.]|jgi:hypothetical protein|nr:RagB/SusD family nutrient uptake outer membrane protein [Tannerella sp.]
MKKYILLSLLALTLSGCDYLDVVPDNLATIEMAFNTRNSAERFLATCYGYIPEYANPVENFALVAGDEIWYYAEKDFYMNNETSLRLAKNMQNAIDPYCNFWEGRQGGMNMFIAIRDCNIFLENLGDIPGLEMGERKRWIAEVQVLKAFFNFWLMRMYGPIPIIEKNLPADATSEEIRLKREPVDKVVAYIVSLLDEAIASGALPEKITDIHSEYGRLTLSAAKAIKAQALVCAASPLFNGNTDMSGFKDKDGTPLVSVQYSPEKWIAARDACKDAIDEAESAGHGLYDFKDLLPIGEINASLRHELTLRATITDRYNKELIWGIGHNWVTALESWCQPRFTSHHAAAFNDAKKSHAPTMNVIEDFYTFRGVPINEDKNWDYAGRYQTIDIKGTIAEQHKYALQSDYTTAKLHTYREPRFYSYVGFDGGKWFTLEAPSDNEIPFLNVKAGQLSGRGGLELYSITGYFAKKLVNYQNVITQSSTKIIAYTFPIIRLSDLYLLYSEALNETKDAPDQEVYEYIQRVRNKAGLDQGGNLVKTWETHSRIPDKPKTKDGMREIIQRERMIELVFEGPRYWDLRRWKLAESYFSRPIRGWNIYATDVAGFYQVRNIYFRDFLNKDYLWPISQEEMLRNPNLVQSPGW